jgi:hypothetical protein
MSQLLSVVGYRLSVLSGNPGMYEPITDNRPLTTGGRA